MPHSLLGNGPSRNYKIYRTEFPAIFRFNGRMFIESFGTDEDDISFTEIEPEQAAPWLKGKESA